jgi:hypothetical protein
MPENPARQTGAGQICALLIAGFGIGWLAGLSLSPVVGTVLGAIVSVVGGVVAGLASAANDPARQRVNAWPAALLVLGIAVGSPAGILARSHDLFGRAVLLEAGQAGGAASAAPSKTVQDPRAPAALGALYSVVGDDCKRLVGSPDQALAGALETSRFPWAPRLARRLSDPKVLRQVVESLCEE